MNMILKCVVIIGVIFIAGCSSTQRKVTLEGTTKKINLSDLPPGETAYMDDGDVPTWIRWPKISTQKKDDQSSKYFLGQSQRFPTAQEAIEDSRLMADREIANWVESQVNITYEAKDFQHKSSTGTIMNTEISHRTFGTQLLQAITQGQYGEEIFTRHGVTNQDGVIQRFFETYRLVGVPVDRLEKNIATTQKGLEQQLVKEQDAVKKESLKINVSFLQSLKNKILGISAQ